MTARTKRVSFPSGLCDEDDALRSGLEGIAAQRAYLVRLALGRMIDQAIGSVMGVEQLDKPVIGLAHLSPARNGSGGSKQSIDGLR